MAQPDVIIVGGGVIGAAIAYYLAEAGVRATLLERSHAGGHASLASAGLLYPVTRAEVPEPLRELGAASFALFPDLVTRLRDISGIDAGYQACGWLRVVMHESDVSDLCAKDRFDAVRENYGLQLLSGEEARRLEPALNPAIVAAIYSPRYGQVYAPALLHAYTHAAARLGTTVRRGIDVVGLNVVRGRVTGVRLSNGDVLTTDQTVIAGGAWTAQVLEPLGMTLPVGPRRGQILALQAMPAPIRHVIFSPTLCLGPKADGSVVVGATYEDVGFDDRLTAAGMEWLLHEAQVAVPALAEATFRQAWVGLRPVSVDGLPLLGAVSAWPGLSVATGHGAHGVVLSPITGLLMAQHLRNQPTDVPLAAFTPERFLPAGTSRGREAVDTAP